MLVFCLARVLRLVQVLLTEINQTQKGAKKRRSVQLDLLCGRYGVLQPLDAKTDVSAADYFNAFWRCVDGLVKLVVGKKAQAFWGYLYALDEQAFADTDDIHAISTARLEL